MTDNPAVKSKLDMAVTIGPLLQIGNTLTPIEALRPDWLTQGAYVSLWN
jgi:hypothetical protein